MVVVLETKKILITGFEPSYVTSKTPLGSVTLDLTWLREIVGENKFGWKEGVRRMVEAVALELLLETRN